MPLMYMSPERLAVFIIFNQSKNITIPKKEKQNRTGEKLHSFSLGVEQEMLLLSACMPTLLQLRCKNKRERKERESFVWSHYWAGLVPEHHVVAAQCVLKQLIFLTLILTLFAVSQDFLLFYAAEVGFNHTNTLTRLSFTKALFPKYFSPPCHRLSCSQT